MKRILKKMLPAAAKRAIVLGIDGFSLFLARACATNGVLAGLYYAFFSRRFDREHLAVLRGRLAYAKSLREIGETSPLLRRNIHRLEKGLIMKPRRPLFAEGFIAETVHCYARAAANLDYSPAELKWATDVLDAYFDVVEPSPVVEQAQQVYALCSQTRGTERPILVPPTFRPYPRSDSPPCNISHDALQALFIRRRSVRWYQPIPVPGDLIQKCIDSAALAPSACNRQPFRFIVANGVERASRVAQCAGGTVGFAEQLPAVVVVVGDLSAYPKEQDRHLIYIDGSLASMQFMLAAETLGLSTCPINWPDVDAAEVRLQKLIHLPEYERVVMLIAVGYPDEEGGIPYSQKKEYRLLGQDMVTDDH